MLFVALLSQHLQRDGVMYLTDGQLVEISNGSNCILGQISSKKMLECKLRLFTHCV